MARCDTVIEVLCPIGCEKRFSSSVLDGGRTLRKGWSGGGILEHVYTQGTLRERAVLLACRRDPAARSGHVPRCISRLRTLCIGAYCWLDIMRLGALGVSAALVEPGPAKVFDLRRIPGESLSRKPAISIVAGRCNR